MLHIYIWHYAPYVYDISHLRVKENPTTRAWILFKNTVCSGYAKNRSQNGTAVTITTDRVQAKQSLSSWSCVHRTMYKKKKKKPKRSQYVNNSTVKWRLCRVPDSRINGIAVPSRHSWGKSMWITPKYGEVSSEGRGRQKNTHFYLPWRSRRRCGMWPRSRWAEREPGCRRPGIEIGSGTWGRSAPPGSSWCVSDSCCVTRRHLHSRPDCPAPEEHHTSLTEPPSLTRCELPHFPTISDRTFMNFRTWQRTSRLLAKNKPSLKM